MIPDNDSQHWHALWKAQEGMGTPMKAEAVCGKAVALERKIRIEYWGVPAILALFAAKAALYCVQFSEPWIRAGWAWGAVTFLYAAARWLQFGPPDPIQTAAPPETCVSFLRGELRKKRGRILEMRWILLLLLPAQCASWFGGGPAEVLKRLGIDWPALLRFQQSPGPLIGLALLLAFVWFKLGAEAEEIRREIDALEASL